MEESRLWSFVADMNQSGSVTISDAWLWFKWLYFYPGDFIFSIFMGMHLGNFLELSAASYGNFWSGLISFIVWLSVFAIIGLIDEQ